MAKTVTLGLMSGTSLDGVDAVAVDFSGVGPRLIGHHHIEFPKPLKEKLLALCQPGDNEIDRMGVASVELGKFYVNCVNELLDVADIGRKDVAAVGIHGQTIRHRPEQGWTLQLNNPALVAELSGLDVISDFRSRDIAAAMLKSANSFYDSIGVNRPLTEQEVKIVDLIETKQFENVEKIIDNLFTSKNFRQNGYL